MKTRIELRDCGGRRKPRVIECETGLTTGWMNLLKVFITREGRKTEEFTVAISKIKGHLTMEKVDSGSERRGT